VSKTPVNIDLYFFCGVLLFGMPGKRDISQTTMTVSMSKRFLGMVDDVCRRALRGAPRAQVVRDALQHYLREVHHLSLPDDEVLPPARSGAHRHSVVMESPQSEAATPLPPRQEVTYAKPKRAKKKP